MTNCFSSSIAYRFGKVCVSYWGAGEWVLWCLSKISYHGYHKACGQNPGHEWTRIFIIGSLFRENFIFTFFFFLLPSIMINISIVGFFYHHFFFLSGSKLVFCEWRYMVCNGTIYEWLRISLHIMHKHVHKDPEITY